jgi:N-methylhydantoinase B
VATTERAGPVELEVWNQLLASVAEEMGAALGRAALSPNIKERRDRSCAIFDDAGRMIAQAAHIPVHLGATPLSVRAVIAKVPLADGECAIVNDPYAGGTHLPDVTLVAAVDAPEAEPVGNPPRRFYLACRAHHADVGGSAPGSFAVGARAAPGELPTSEGPVIALGPKYRIARGGRPRAPAITIDDEGVRVAPRLLTDDVIEWFAAQSRTPDERRGDLAAQRACLAVGRTRLLSLCARHGAAVVASRGAALRALSARILGDALEAIPDGTYAFADSLDDDGAGTEEVGVRARITIAGRRARVDFSDSDDESPGALNAVLPVTLSAVLYAFRLLCPDDTPTNEGLLEPIEVVAPEGTIVNARPPRAVAAGNVETAQRIVDVVLGALAQALPSRIPAASAGTMSNLLFGGVGEGGPFAYYETIPGGAGGGPDGPGASAIQTHMTNTWSTPTEALERATPVRVWRSALRRGSGGRGAEPGGDGVERVIEFLAPATVTLVGDRRRRPPYGLAGGGPGAVGEELLERGGRAVKLPSKCTFEAEAGDRLIVRTPGGGGFGDPRRKRAPVDGTG